MLVIVLENSPPRLTGRLSLWFAEVRSGVFVGKATQKLRERIWAEICADLGEGNAVMVASSPNEGGFVFWTAGANRRRMVLSDGLPLVAFEPVPGNMPPT